MTEDFIQTYSKNQTATSEYESRADDEVDADSTMACRSRKQSSDPQEDDSTMVDEESRQSSPNVLVDDASESMQPLNNLREDDSSESVEPLKNLNLQEEDAGKSMEPLSHTQEDDSTMDVIQSMELLSHTQKDDSTMDVIQSRRPLPNPQEDDASMIGVESGVLLPEADKDGEDGQPRNGVDSSDSMVVVEPMGPLSESDNVEEGQSTKGGGVVEATPANDETLLDIESLVTATFEPRRSSRNISSKNKPAGKYAAAPKSLGSKRKPPTEKEDVVLHTSFHADSDDDRPKLSDVEKAAVGFNYFSFTSDTILMSLYSSTQHSMLISQDGDQLLTLAKNHTDMCRFRSSHQETFNR